MNSGAKEIAVTDDKGAQWNEKWLISAFLLLFIGGYFALPLLGFLLPTVSDQLLDPAAFTTVRNRENFATYFISIALEAAPYMVIGAFVSALIEIWVPNNFLPRLAKSLGFWGVPAMVLAAPILPICECAVVIVAHRLLKKGLPLPHTITYLLAAPIVNPVVLTGTWLAFFQDLSYPIMRGLGGAVIAISIGWLLYRLPWEKALLPHVRVQNDGDSCGREGGGCSHGHSHEGGGRSRLGHALSHARDDFLDMGVYFLMGVFLAASMKTFLGNDILSWLGDGPIIGPFSMMVAAFVLSLCSEADAFLAASFTEFDMFAHMAFLIFGPMMDIKLVLMYRTLFTGRFIALLATLITLGTVCYITFLQLVGSDWLFALSMEGLM
ncbi:MAG: permease [Magnetococcales bacterium]|nr:permease [Magnetococcales bacterium]